MSRGIYICSQGHRFQIQDDIPLPNSDQYPYPSLYNHTHVSAAAAVPQHAGSASSEVSIEQNRDMKHKNLRSTSHNRHNQPTQMRTPGPPHTSGDHYLSDREARDAIHYMEKRTLRNPAQPWFIQVLTDHSDVAYCALFVTYTMLCCVHEGLV